MMGLKQVFNPCSTCFSVKGFSITGRYSHPVQNKTSLISLQSDLRDHFSLSDLILKRIIEKLRQEDNYTFKGSLDYRDKHQKNICR